MASTPKGDVGGELPELGFLELLNIFVPGRVPGPVRITRDEPLTCVLWRDATGQYFLSPEEDYRFSDGYAISALEVSAKVKTEFLDKVVEVAGVFEDGKGLTIEAITLDGQPFAA